MIKKTMKENEAVKPNSCEMAILKERIVLWFKGDLLGLFDLDTHSYLYTCVKTFLLSIALLMSCAVIATEDIPMKFCGMQLGQQIPEGLELSSQTELYYGYSFSANRKILRFNQYQLHASLITKTVISAGAGYTTDSKSDAKSLFNSTCYWLEQKYPNKKCEDCNLPNRTIKVMRFGKDTDGFYMLELVSSGTGMYIVVLSLYNDKLSNLGEREAKEFAAQKITGQSAPLQYSVYQVNNNLNQGKPIYTTFTNSIAQSSPSQATLTMAFDNTKDTMGLIRRVIEDYQRRNKTRSAPKDLLELKSIAKSAIDSWKDGWGNDFAYKCKGDRWTLQSAGTDKKYDTDDDLLFICEDGMNVTTVGFPTGNGRYLDSEVVEQNNALREEAGEEFGGRPDGWTLVEIPGFVSVDIPPTMELQKGSYKVFKETIAKITLDLDMRDQALTFQQSGLNDHEEGSTRRYARIVFKSFFDKDQNFTLTDNELTPDVLKVIEEDEYANIKKGFDQINRSGLSTAKLLKWFPVKKVQVGGLSGYRIAFLRQQKTFPPVYVEDYKLGNGHYLYTITFSYRQSEESFWKEDYDTIKRRIRFNLKK